MKSFSFSHKGRRDVNQDLLKFERLTNESSLALIVDGMGGYDHGDLAAKVVSESIYTYLSQTRILDSEHVQKAINKSNLAINQVKIKTGSQLGATVGGIVLSPSKHFCFWIGDVKIYHFRKNNLVFESHSHTLVNELLDKRPVIDPNQITRYKHVVTRSVQGELSQSQADFHAFGPLEIDDIIIMCSDGVHDLLGAYSLEMMLKSSKRIEEFVERIEHQLLKEATDNFTFFLGLNDE